VVGCHECADALTKETSAYSIRIGDKEIEYADKNMWRCSWAEHFGLDVELPIPEEVTEEVILATRAKHGARGGAMGYCLKFCMVPQLRMDDPDYTRVWRRKKSVVPTEEVSPRDITERVKALSIEKGADLVGIASAEELGKHGIPAKNYLPEGVTAIVIGMEYPSSYDENPGALSYIRGMIATKLQFISLDVSSHLERLGYSALPRSGMPDSKAAMAAGLISEEGGRQVFTMSRRASTRCQNPSPFSGLLPVHIIHAKGSALPRYQTPTVSITT
jgi:hypothetical protein